MDIFIKSGVKLVADMDRYKTYRPQKRAGTPLPKRRLRFALAVLLIIAASFLGFIRVLGNNKIDSLPVISEVARAIDPPQEIAPLVLTADQQSAMESQINAAIKARPDMKVGVAVQDLNNRRTYIYGQTQPFIAASVTKIITAAMYLHGAETGRYSLNKKLSFGTAGYELQQMIVVSDNKAWDDLARVLTHKGMTGYMQEMGVTDYDPQQNTLSAGDVALLLGKLYKGELLNRSDTDLLLSYMKESDYSTYIPASVPTGINVYHKAGWLTERVNDAAIIDNGKHPY
ncbi:MAG TPA: serine hydrolase, partial [Candidatus Saccharimonadales bacterium]|nr:serine hydrolase [Candidatus Saccharimonadales bacterium]